MLARRMTSTASNESRALEDRVAALEADLAQRRAELAILSDVGEALAKQLDLTAIAELVGERLHETFPGVGLYVALYDAATNMISFPYEVDIAAGRRYHTDSFPADSGMTAAVIRARTPKLIRTADEAERAGAIITGRTRTESWLGVPLLAGDDVIGVFALESDKPHAFDADDVRLVSTLASTTAAALRNARLFDEEKRLLGETEQRNAELAVINEIAAALAKQVDFQSTIDAVGDRIQVDLWRWDRPDHAHRRRRLRPCRRHTRSTKARASRWLTVHSGA